MEASHLYVRQVSIFWLPAMVVHCLSLRPCCLCSRVRPWLLPRPRPQNPLPNAYTLAIAGRKPFIVLHTALLDLLTPEEVQAVLAHELGHLKCDHGEGRTSVRSSMKLSRLPSRSAAAGVPQQPVLCARLVALLLMPPPLRLIACRSVADCRQRARAWHRVAAAHRVIRC